MKNYLHLGPTYSLTYLLTHLLTHSPTPSLTYVPSQVGQVAGEGNESHAFGEGS